MFLCSRYLKLFLGSLTSFGLVMSSGTLVEAIPLVLSQTPNCRNPQTQSDINYCAGVDFQRADGELNRVYRLVIPKLSGTRRNQLVLAQTAWIRFRNNECDFAGSEAEGGSLQPALIAGCSTQLTTGRTAELNAYLRSRNPSAPNINYRTIDSRLNASYQQLRSRLQGRRISQLDRAERAWIQFRDANCEFEQGNGGTAARNACLVRMTQQRNGQLADYLESTSR